jgi:hypothetical protein
MGSARSISLSFLRTSIHDQLQITSIMLVDVQVIVGQSIGVICIFLLGLAWSIKYDLLIFMIY